MTIETGMAPAPQRARIGLIGAGWWATSNHLPLLAARPDVELAAVCRLGTDELRRVQERFAFPFATEDYRALLDQPLDGVIVASPHTLHYEHARAALLKGMHVLVEKPMTTRADQAWELVRLANQRGLSLVVPYGWHYKPFVLQAKQLMDQGAVGRVRHVSCHMASPILDLLSGRGSVDQARSGSADQADLLFSPTPSTWADPAIAGGGYGHAQLSHATGLLCWLTGLRAEEVFARMSSPGAQVDLYDALSVRFEGGAIGAVSGAGSVPADGPFQLDIRIFGADGQLCLDVERERVEVRRHDGTVTHIPVSPGEGAYSCEGPPNRFVDLILGLAERNDSPGEAAARSVELLDAAYRSAASGAPERVQL